MSEGGIILIGVTNDGQIVGQDATDNTRQEIAREINKIEPSTQIEIDYVPIREKKYVIAIKIVSGKHSPYVYDGRPYERTQTTTEKMTQHRYEQLLVKRGQLNHSWEEEPAEGYNINSLDDAEIRRTIKQGVDNNRIGVEVLHYDIENILTNLKLLRNGQLINAAVVLYAKDVLPKYSNCMIRMARFKGIDKLGDFIDNQRVYGNAFHLLSSANNFAQRHLPIASFFEPDRLQRIDQPAIPALALREALINAISHRDYTNRSSTISLAIFDDRLELWNNGELPPELKIEDLRKRHESYPRNEEIATIFYKRGWVEGWGTGTTRMIGNCKKNGTPEPEFQEYSGGFSITFRFKDPMASIEKRPFATSEQLTLRQKEIIDILNTYHEMATKDIMQHLKKPPAMRTLRDDLTYLKKMGIVDFRGHTRAITWFLVKKT